MDVRARWRPAMWLGAGVSLLSMDDLTARDLSVVEAAAKAYEEASNG